jgi:hypothetical protein
MKYLYTFILIFLLCSTTFAQKAELLKKCEADYKLEKYKSLWDNCDSYLELDTMCARVYLLKAHALLNIYDQSWAVDDFKKCLELDPSNIEALFWVKLNDRWFLEDWEYYEIMKLDTSYYYPYLHMAWKKNWEYNLDYDISFLDSVESLLDRAIELKPNDYASILERGEYFLLMKEYKLAEKDFNKAITIKPHEVVAYKVRGQALYYQNKFALAINDLTKYINEKTPIITKHIDEGFPIDDEYTDMFILRANSYAKLGNRTLALNDYNRVLSLKMGPIISNKRFQWIYNDNDCIEKWSLVLNNLTELTINQITFNLIITNENDEVLFRKKYTLTTKLSPGEIVPTSSFAVGGELCFSEEEMDKLYFEFELEKIN